MRKQKIELSLPESDQQNGSMYTYDYERQFNRSDVDSHEETEAERAERMGDVDYSQYDFDEGFDELDYDDDEDNSYSFWDKQEDRRRAEEYHEQSEEQRHNTRYGAGRSESKRKAVSENQPVASLKTSPVFEGGAAVPAGGPPVEGGGGIRKRRNNAVKAS